LLNKRYEHYEEKRKSRIQLATEKRKELIESKKKDHVVNMGMSHVVIDHGSSALKEEQRRLEKLRNKQVINIYLIFLFRFGNYKILLILSLC
jgi:hypothetical protein